MGTRGKGQFGEPSVEVRSSSRGAMNGSRQIRTPHHTRRGLWDPGPPALRRHLEIAHKAALCVDLPQASISAWTPDGLRLIASQYDVLLDSGMPLGPCCDYALPYPHGT